MPGLAPSETVIGLQWQEMTGSDSCTAYGAGNAFADGTPLKLSEKDQKWLGLEDTFRF